MVLNYYKASNSRTVPFGLLSNLLIYELQVLGNGSGRYSFVVLMCPDCSEVGRSQITIQRWNRFMKAHFKFTSRLRLISHLHTNTQTHTFLIIFSPFDLCIYVVSPVVVFTEQVYSQVHIRTNCVC